VHAIVDEGRAQLTLAIQMPGVENQARHGLVLG